MDKLNRNLSKVNTNQYPVKILQFGEGNFLRSFVDWMIHEMNQKTGFNAGVTVVQPIDKGMVSMLNEQDGLFNIILNGIKDGEALSENYLIDCVQKGINPYNEFENYLAEADNPELQFITSNTTEAGISYSENDKFDDAPPASFPAKLTLFLYRRFTTFNGQKDKGFYILPCELIQKNGEKLKEYVLQYAHDWNLNSEFIEWIETANHFYNTLVDRIVPGFPKQRIEQIHEELGYIDDLVSEGEQFHLWVIEGEQSIKNAFPAHEAGLNVVFTDDLNPYRTRKVRILNGAHTSMVPVGLIYGTTTVKETIEHPVIGTFLEREIYQEIIPALDQNQKELEAYAREVIFRFRNPYVKHYLTSIMLNSLSKFETRVLPSLIGYIDNKGKLPECIVFALAALLRLYKGDITELKDGTDLIDKVNNLWKSHENNLEELVRQFLAMREIWKTDLNEISGLQAQVTKHLSNIYNNSIEQALKSLQQ